MTGVIAQRTIASWPSAKRSYYPVFTVIPMVSSGAW